MTKSIDRKTTRAAIANSLRRAESLSVTPQMMERPPKVSLSHARSSNPGNRHWDGRT
jgi:hypothetical protein